MLKFKIGDFVKIKDISYIVTREPLVSDIPGYGYLLLYFIENKNGCFTAWESELELDIKEMRNLNINKLLYDEHK